MIASLPNAMHLDDLFHLPALDAAFARLVSDRSGLILVAGIDLVPPAAEESSLLSSGRTTIFRVLAEALLANQTAPATLVAADASAFRVPWAHRRRLGVLRVTSPSGYGPHIERALAQGVGLLLIDQLTTDNASLVIAAARVR